MTWDRILLLHLLHSAQDTKVVDNVKVQKLTFISEVQGAELRLKTAHYPFFRYNFGPYSKELAKEVSFLEALGFINNESRELTSRADVILRYIQPEIDDHIWTIRELLEADS